MESQSSKKELNSDEQQADITKTALKYIEGKSKNNLNLRFKTILLQKQ
jgi:hypothetical protein